MGAFRGNNRVAVAGEDQWEAASMHVKILPFAQIINSDTGITSDDLAAGRCAVMISPGAGVKGVPVTEGTLEEITGFVTWVDTAVTADGTNNVPNNVKVQVDGVACNLYATDNPPAKGDRVILSTEKGRIRKSIEIDSNDITAAGIMPRGSRNWYVTAIRSDDEEVDLILL